MGIVFGENLKYNYVKFVLYRISEEVKCKIGNVLKNDIFLIIKDF